MSSFEPEETISAQQQTLESVDAKMRLNNDKLKSVLVNTVHDSVVLDVHPAEEGSVLGIIKDVNDNLKRIIEQHYDIEVNVPMLLESKIGDNWLDVKDVV